ncbi:DNA starvation/stationary phase protection protein Dps [Pseudosulfitobacter koreensis]|uniref:DNA starvation/stationary phase protection protein Dps n=1 Tax=Pseudosulfitobacter koreensis TaxID=2968472 RepID=A0ABT1YX29_9RHOB|nr:DNA starvation/stationary phase protection protein Dps [Pseudosulfitobacter koreense]MCR8825429.1 DNA starvation/stationary phase protection protein Dps [Pseudosulfitobacter koreense]
MTEKFTDYLTDNAREASINHLNTSLATGIQLQLAIKQAHWNIKGPSFIGIHELLDDVRARLDDHVDTIAERIVILGGTADGTEAGIEKNGQLEAYPRDAVHQDVHIEELKKRMMHFVKLAHEGLTEAGDAGDEETADLYTAVSRGVSKDAWFIGAHHTNAKK